MSKPNTNARVRDELGFWGARELRRDMGARRDPLRIRHLHANFWRGTLARLRCSPDAVVIARGWGFPV